MVSKTAKRVIVVFSVGLFVVATGAIRLGCEYSRILGMARQQPSLTAIFSYCFNRFRCEYDFHTY